MNIIISTVIKKDRINQVMSSWDIFLLRECPGWYRAIGVNRILGLHYSTEGGANPHKEWHALLSTLRKHYATLKTP